MKTLIVTATQSKVNDYFKQSILFRSLSHTFLENGNHSLDCFKCTSHDITYDYVQLADNISHIICANNKNKLACVYNAVLEEVTKRDYKYLVFVHDDVSIEDSFFLSKLDNIFKQYDICGLAGASTAKIQEPCLWHLMSEQKSWSGAVAHPFQHNQQFVTTFGPSPQRVLLLDGLFLGVKVESIKHSGLKFDESNPCIAHFYDLDFCLSANLKKLKMSTVPIWCVHNSPGLRSLQDPEFLKGQEWFMKKWKNHA